MTHGIHDNTGTPLGPRCGGRPRAWARRTPPVWLTPWLAVALGLAACGGADHDPFRDVADVAALDEQSLFTFAIFSDNKGVGPETGIAMEGMLSGVNEMEAAFVLGLGDHLQGPPLEEQDFLPWVTADPWWRDHFYPVAADGENNYYGTGQGDWGAGRGLIDDLGLCDQPEVSCQDNHVDYHATIEVEGVTVHFIVAHYPDTGDDPFPEDSRQYLIDEVQRIERTGEEIVIAAAHTDDWVEDLSEPRQEVMLSGCDLLLGATTHVYKRYDYPDDAALFLNTGSTGFTIWNNYLQVNVLTEPLRIVVQNMKAVGGRFLQADENCWVKEIGGLVSPCDFTNGEPWPPLFPE